MTLHARLPANRRRGGRLVLMLGLALGGACGGTTDPGRPGTPVVGSWNYVAQQLSPAPTNLSGVLVFTTQSGAQLSGTLDVVETDARGQQRRLAGPLAGRTADSTTLDFEVVVGAVSRRHVGQVKADSLTGTWVETGAGGAPTASGTFRSARTR